MSQDPSPSRRPVRSGPSRRQVLFSALPAALVAAPTWAQSEPSDMEKIRASGALKVAVYKDYEPFSYGSASDMRGLDVAVAQALAQQLQLRLALLPFDAGENMNDDLRNMVWRGHYLGYGPADVMMHVPVDRFLMNENRQALIFSPYMRQVPVVFHDSRKLPEVREPEDLKGAPLAAERGAGTASALMAYQGGLLRQQVAIHTTGVAAARAVVDGMAAAAYVTRAQAEAALAAAGASAQGGPFRFAEVRFGLFPERGWPIGMAIKSANKELGQSIEGAMQRLRSSGEMVAIFQRHGLTLTAP